MFRGLDLRIPAGSSLAVVGRNGAGKTTLAKLLCRLYDPTGGAIEADGVDLRSLDLASWRSRITAVFQDFIRYEWSLRDNVAPRGATDGDVEWALRQAGASRECPAGHAPGAADAVAHVAPRVRRRAPCWPWCSP